MWLEAAIEVGPAGALSVRLGGQPPLSVRPLDAALALVLAERLEEHAATAHRTTGILGALGAPEIEQGVARATARQSRVRVLVQLRLPPPAPARRLVAVATLGPDGRVAFIEGLRPASTFEQALARLRLPHPADVWSDPRSRAALLYGLGLVWLAAMPGCHPAPHMADGILAGFVRASTPVRAAAVREATQRATVRVVAVDAAERSSIVTAIDDTLRRCVAGTPRAIGVALAVEELAEAGGLDLAARYAEAPVPVVFGGATPGSGGEAKTGFGWLNSRAAGYTGAARLDLSWEGASWKYGSGAPVVAALVAARAGATETLAPFASLEGEAIAHWLPLDVPSWAVDSTFPLEAPVDVACAEGRVVLVTAPQWGIEVRGGRTPMSAVRQTAWVEGVGLRDVETIRLQAVLTEALLTGTEGAVGLDAALARRLADKKGSAVRLGTTWTTVANLGGMAVAEVLRAVASRTLAPAGQRLRAYLATLLAMLVWIGIAVAGMWFLRVIVPALLPIGGLVLGLARERYLNSLRRT